MMKDCNPEGDYRDSPYWGLEIPFDFPVISEEMIKLDEENRSEPDIGFSMFGWTE